MKKTIIRSEIIQYVLITITAILIYIPPVYASYTGVDIGDVGYAGSVTLSGDQYTISGSGWDIYGQSDAFYYVYWPLSGDGSITARVVSLTNTNQWAKSGVMIRESRDASSKEAAVVLTPENGISFQYRSSTGSGTNWMKTDASAPYHVKLERSGNMFTSSKSTDGVNWTSISSTTITMAENIYIGLCVTAHDNTAINTTVFDNVTLTSGGTPEGTDTYEEDDSYSEATTIMNGTPQEHNFYDDAEDWVTLPVQSGSTYTFESVVTGSADTVFYLYDSSLSQLAYDDDGGVGYASKITYTAARSGTCYLKIFSYGGNTGENREYTVSLSVKTTSGTLQAFLLAGQSNMEGHLDDSFYDDLMVEIETGPASTLKTRLEDDINYWYENYDGGYAQYAWSTDVSSYEAEELVRLYNSGLVGEHINDTRTDVWCASNSNTVGNLSTGYGYPFGPELILGHYLGNASTPSVSLVKVAHGGSTLHTDWVSPTAAARTGKSTGPYYTELKNRILTLSTNPDSVNPDGNSEWSAFIWFQGENDCFDSEGAAGYEQNLKDLITDVRAETGSPSLPVVIVEIGYWAQTLSYGNLVQQAQQNVANDDPNTVIVTSDDLSRFFHYDPPSQLIIGERIGHALETLVP